ncbi:hypothetical protein ACC691_41100, partial [Rhizobium johnstonii]|uniref:hypothetical protein n=1 Tax=Rhizobium johnstonii TaxID=3019933 RepID=UPI003F993463
AGFYNWSGYSNDEVTADIQTARTTLDPQGSADAFVAAMDVTTPVSPFLRKVVWYDDARVTCSWSGAKIFCAATKASAE